MPGYRLEVEFDHEPAYIFGPEQGEDAEPLITIAPGNPELAECRPARPSKGEPMICPECGSQNIVEAVTDWQARSLEPTDLGNTAVLVECQCADCSRAFWLATGDDGSIGFPSPAISATITPADVITALGLTQAELGEDDAAAATRLAKIAQAFTQNQTEVAEAMRRAGVDFFEWRAPRSPALELPPDLV